MNDREDIAGRGGRPSDVVMAVVVAVVMAVVVDVVTMPEMPKEVN